MAAFDVQSSPPKLGQGVYAYEHNLNDHNVLILINGGDKGVNLPLARYTEILRRKDF